MVGVGSLALAAASVGEWVRFDKRFLISRNHSQGEIFVRDGAELERAVNTAPNGSVIRLRRAIYDVTTLRFDRRCTLMLTGEGPKSVIRYTGNVGIAFTNGDLTIKRLEMLSATSGTSLVFL